MILDGKIAANHYLEKIKQTIAKLEFTPKLTIIQVGENPASTTYINIKKKTLSLAGIEIEHINFPEDVTSEDLASQIHNLNIDESVNGILVQLPLPNHLDERSILDFIAPKKRRRLPYNLQPWRIFYWQFQSNASNSSRCNKSYGLLQNRNLWQKYLYHRQKQFGRQTTCNSSN